jgi:hypothetical protein
MKFRLPGAEDRTVVIGATGTGKTVFGAWLLSRQNFKARPWVCIDYKNEILWDMVGDPPMRDLRINQMPGKIGLYRLRVRPDQDEELEAWLWEIWSKENVGLFCDEASLLPKGSAFKAVLRQGRSKRIPVISCTQRPVEVDREVFTEAQYVSVFRVQDKRDYKIVSDFTNGSDVSRPLPPHCSYWYDARQSHLFTLKPCPDAPILAERLKEEVPYRWFLSL